MYIITDSTASWQRDYIKKHNIEVIPVLYMFEGKTYNDGFDGENDDYYRRLQQSTEFPSTSQISIETFREAFERGLKQDGEVLALIFSSHISGSCSSAFTAATMVNPDKITVVDTLCTAATLEYMVDIAVEMRDKGATRQEIAAEIEKQCHNTKILLTVATLEYLKRGGRLTGAKAAIASVLNIRPIIEFSEGALNVVDKPRGMANALKRVVEMIPDNAKRITVLHVINQQGAETLREQILQKFPSLDISIRSVSPVVGSHIGPEGLAVGMMW